MSEHQTFKGTLAAAIGLSAVFGVATASTATAQTELRLHTFVPPGHIIYTQIIQPLAEQIAEETGGEVTLTPYPSMQLGGKAPELMRQAADGTVDMVFSLPGYTSAQFPRTQMLELPGLRPDGMAATELLWDLHDGGYLDGDYDGVKVLGLWAADDVGIYTRDKPVRTVEDIAGLLLRSPSAAQAGQIEVLGGTPVAMPIPQLYPQLERGVIDGALVPFTTILDFRMHEVADYYTIMGPTMGRSQFAIVMNEDSYNSLAPEHQEVIDRLTGEEWSRRATQFYLDRAAESIAFVRTDDSKEVIEFSEEEQDKLRAALAPIYEQWLEDMSAQGIDGAALLAVAGIEMN
ncbi:MAG: TRAP transporter substrate-binding protein [Paracoccaceae bacterium]|nr:TRAP transporter substrate-binding protein [Paracoccaceae bacterium]